MKRGLAIFISVLAVFFFSLTFIKAYNGYPGYYGYGGGGFLGFPSISELAQNEWFNAALLFLLILAVCWFVLQRVFQASRGAAIVVSIVLGVMGAFGLIYFYGPILARFGNLFIILIFAVIVLLLLVQLRRMGLGLMYILIALSLVWLLWAHRQFCPPFGTFLPQEICTLLDTIAIAILIIGIIMLLIWLLNKLRGKIIMGPPTPREPRPPKGEKERPVLTLGVQGGGVTKPKPGQYRCRLNQKVKVGIDKPFPTWVFSHWILDGRNVGHYPTINVIMNTDHHLIAVFTKGEEKEMILDIGVQGHGTTNPTPGRHTYKKGTTVILTATPESGYKFKYWIIDGRTEKKNPYQIVMDRNHNVIAVFTGKVRPPGEIAEPVVIARGQEITGGKGVFEIAADEVLTLEVWNRGAGGNVYWKIRTRPFIYVSKKGGGPLKPKQHDIIQVKISDWNSFLKNPNTSVVIVDCGTKAQLRFHSWVVLKAKGRILSP